VIQLAVVLFASQQVPTYVDESKLQMFNGHFVVESPVTEKPGLFVIKNSKLSTEVVDKAANYLKGLQPEFVVRKELNGSLTAWNMNGTPRALKEGDVSDDIAKSLYAGEPVLKVSRSAEVRNREYYNHHFMIQGEIYTEMREKTDTVIAWFHLGKPHSNFVNVQLRDDVRLDLGSLDIKEGTKSTIDGISFEVNAIDQIKGFTKKVVFISQGKEDPQGDYGFEIGIDSARFKADHPNVEARSYTSFGSESTSDLPGKVYRQFRVGSNRPDEYWKQLNIYRTSTVHGYFGHVATAPYSDQ
jgi:hypothetical protein